MRVNHRGLNAHIVDEFLDFSEIIDPEGAASERKMNVILLLRMITRSLPSFEGYFENVNLLLITV